MLQRKEQRVLELQEMKKKTQHVMRSMESSSPPRTQQSPFGNRVISISLRRIGIVFPLSLKTTITTLAPSTFASLEAEKAPAFLVTVQSLDFVTQRDETGNARMFGLAFQFVPR
jgi:protein CSF1